MKKIRKLTAREMMQKLKKIEEKECGFHLPKGKWINSH